MLPYLDMNNYTNNTNNDDTFSQIVSCNLYQSKIPKPNIYCYFLQIFAPLQELCSIELIAIVDWIPDVTLIYCGKYSVFSSLLIYSKGEFLRLESPKPNSVLITQTAASNQIMCFWDNKCFVFFTQGINYILSWKPIELVFEVQDIGSFNTITNPQVWPCRNQCKLLAKWQRET